MNDMMSAWRDGDEESLSRLLTREFTADERLLPVYQKVILDRNHSMAQWLDTRMSSGGDVFAVIGAGHVVGAEGLPALMRARGYRVERISSATALR